MAKVYGKAAVGGIPGTITHGSLGNGTITQQGMDMGHNWTEEVLRDPDSGKPLGFYCTDDAYDLTIDWIPTSATTKAYAAEGLPFPAPYTVVTISGADDGDMNDTWLYVGGATKAATPNAMTRIRMPLRRYRECDDAEHAALAVAAS